MYTGLPKARTVLEMGRLKNPHSDIIWMEAVRLEFRSGEEKLAETMMAKALQVWMYVYVCMYIYIYVYIAMYTCIFICIKLIYVISYY